MPPLTLREGALVGKYRLIEARGAGAMGAVWSAVHATIGSRVAIKFLRPSGSSSADARARFDREARLAAQLGEASRNISRVIDHGVTELGVPYLVMELLEGEELAVRLRREGRMSLAAAAPIVAQLCRALAVAHAAAVVHRDVKPANVFLCTISRRGRRWMTGERDDLLVKLMDFGVAKALFGEGEIGEEETTRAGTVIGTPAYMSPEQVLARELDARSDLWGVAAMTYRMVVGCTPFGNGSFGELAVRIVGSDPIAPTQLVPELPAELDRWMATGLAKRREDRFQSAHELAASLSAIASRAESSGRARRGRRVLELAEPSESGESTTVDRRALSKHSSGVRPRVRAKGAGGAIAWVVFGLLAAVALGGLYARMPNGFALRTQTRPRTTRATLVVSRALQGEANPLATPQSSPAVARATPAR